jgi:uncharacterized membrane protein YeaQ/YmgE (transglycosylase-associated protein family)
LSRTAVKPEVGMSIVSWVALGAVVGAAVHWRRPGRFPGGLAGTVASATAGAFLGGASFTLLAGRGADDLDLASLLVALLGAGLLLLAVRRAAYGEPWTS